ncbi:hypothetical protein MNBD_GAMMA21-1048 [hydrothermal vent metagenome]|uniref:Uncharacterized protein n=1 Tax=hydrothermal vent metagenome TaxID=652676 RepID=A0A3B1A9M2_9ZZZZ
MRYLLLMLFIFVATPSCGYEISIEVDIKKCAADGCFTVFKKNLKISEDLEVLFWADVLKTSQQGSPNLFTMLNVFNRKKDAINLTIEVEVLDENKVSLGKQYIDTEVIPYKEKKNQYDIYKSISAIGLPDGNHIKAKYVILRIDSR